MKNTFLTKYSINKWFLFVLTPLFLLQFISCGKDEFGEGEYSVDYYKDGSLESIPIADLAVTNALANYPPTGIVDGSFSINTRWSSNSLQSELIIDFGEVKTIEYFQIAFASGQQINYSFDVDYLSTSTETTNSTVIWLKGNNSYSSSGETSDFETFYFTDEEPITTQFIKITNLGNSINDNINITEIDFVEYVKTEDLVENIALYKSTDQSSTAIGSLVSAYAVDGTINGIGLVGSVSETQSEALPWWEVFLGNEYSIGDITIWNRTDQCCSSYLENFDVYFYDLEGSLTYTTSIFGAINTKINVNGAGNTASRIRIQLRDTGILSFAEVEVFEYTEDDDSSTNFNDSLDNITIEHLIAKSYGNYNASNVSISDSGIFEEISL